MMAPQGVIFFIWHRTFRKTLKKRIIEKVEIS